MKEGILSVLLTFAVAGMMYSQSVSPPQYYVSVSGTRYGPYTMSDIERMKNANQISGKTLVWRQGMTGWEAAENLSDFDALFLPANPPAPALTPAPAPTPAAPRPAPGALYVGTALQGEMNLLDALEWIAVNAKAGGRYTIALGRDEAITPTALDYGGKTLAIALKSAGETHTVSFAGESPAYSLFIVKAGVTFTLEEGVTLRGTQNDARKSLVEVAGGRFVMNGGTLTGNKTYGGGGGVYVASGTFTMNGGTISENISSWNTGGGGVYVKGTFTMNGGIISGNTTNNTGGAVYVDGTFTMKDGVISGNTGGGVNATTFTMSGGTISENTTGSSGGGVNAMTFTMNGGTISGNTAGSSGGGVNATTFTMSGGTISGNTAGSSGGGVNVNTFTKSGGVIYGSNAEDSQANRAKDDSSGHAVSVYGSGKKRSTTARAATAMDSAKNGPAGGWE